MKITLTEDNIGQINSICRKAPFPVDVCKGRYCVDGASILGLMMFIGSEVDVIPISTDNEAINNFKNKLKTHGVTG